MTKLNPCILRLDESIAHMQDSLPQLPACEAAIARLLKLVGVRMDEELCRKLKPHKLNDSEFLVLTVLYGHPEGSSTPGVLCELTSQGATNMTRIANALVKRGLITRHHSKEDRRSITIRITATGRQFVRKMLPPMFPQLEELFVGFSRTEKQTFNRLLRKLAINLDHLDVDD
ncbi:MarR family winged helix-turn-helix transcriptional regulator [Dyella sp.]|uniref:MarR family winged helix-turn-helix transcriptional regulator n=1 Tax=Dyella sp. TaxID=1869338 RepID=UPI002ED61CAD